MVNDQNRMLFHVYNNWWHHRVSSDHIEVIGKGNHLFTCDLKGETLIKLVLLDDQNVELPNLDYVLVFNDPYLRLDKLDTGYLIINADNLFAKARYWMSSADSLEIPYWNVYRQGAFTKTLK